MHCFHKDTMLTAWVTASPDRCDRIIMIEVGRM